MASNIEVIFCQLYSKIPLLLERIARELRHECDRCTHLFTCTVVLSTTVYKEHLSKTGVNAPRIFRAFFKVSNESPGPNHNFLIVLLGFII